MKSKLFAAALLAPGVVFGAAALPAPGDIAFSTLDAGVEGFALVTFVDLAAGSEFFVTDNEWNSLAVGAGGDFNTGEGQLAWTLDADLLAGSVIYFSHVNSSIGVTATEGVVSRSGRFEIAASGESLTLFATSNGAPVPIAAVGYGSTFAAELTGSGLESAALDLGGDVYFAEYMGPRTGEAQMDAYRAVVFDVANWMVVSPTNATEMLPNLMAFETVAAPVPEPESYAMMLAGLGLVSVIARRRLRY